MKDGFACLFPPPRTVRFGGDSLDIRSVCFPLEIFKKYDFLFGHFGVRNRSRGLQIVFQERPSRSPTRGPGLAGEEYAIDCSLGRIVLSAVSPRGQFYALSTLLQVLAFHEISGRMPAFALWDAPAIAFRGAYFCGETGTATAPSALPGLLLKLALLKFNHLALPADSLPPAAGTAGIDRRALSTLAQRTGMVILLLDPDPGALARLAPAGSLPEDPLRFPDAAKEKENGAAAWFEFFLRQCRTAKAGAVAGGMVVWGDLFLSHPEWIRKIPRDVLVLNREAGLGPGSGPRRGDFFKVAVLPFKEQHIRQVLCPTLCGRGRFLPDARAAMGRVNAAYATAGSGKLAGVMLTGGEGERGGCLPQGAAMVYFQAGCQFWSGRLPGPAAFSRWALGRDEPDLFRVYSFLAQAEHRLPHSHSRYLFEDPLLAPFSRQGDPREVVAHFRKAALYLKKREITANEMTGFFDFTVKLYETIAAKVELSSRLAILLEAAGGGETIRLQAAWLQQAVAELKGLYAGLLGGPLPSGGLKGFDFLGERFTLLGRVASSPTARETLLSALRNDASLNSAAAFPDDPYRP